MFLYSTVSTLKPIVGIVVTPYVWQQWTKPYFTPDRVPGARTHAYGLEMLGGCRSGTSICCGAPEYSLALRDCSGASCTMA